MSTRHVDGRARAAGTRRHRATALVAAGLAGAVGALGLWPGGPSAASTPAAHPRAGWGVNGPVHAVAVVGGTVFVGGDFSAAVSGSGRAVPRANLAAFSLRTGRLVRTWRADTSGPVRALVGTRRSLWIGGGFDSVNGVAGGQVAKVSTRTGAVSATFRVATNGTVRALALSGDRLYAGGDFTAVDGQQHDHLVAVRPLSGGIRASFRGSTDGTVWSLAAAPSPGPVYVGGLFGALGGAPRGGLGAVDRVTGATTRAVFRQASGPVYSLDLARHGRRVVAAVGGPPTARVGNSISAWTARSGRRAWTVKLRGDGQAVRVFRGTVYAGFHAGYRQDRSARLLAIAATSGRVRPFRPRFAGFWGVRAIGVSRRGLAVGGQFTRVAGTRVRNLAVFGFRAPGGH